MPCGSGKGDALVLQRLAQRFQRLLRGQLVRIDRRQGAHDSPGRLVLGDAASRLNAVHLRHGDVHDDHIGAVLLVHLQRLFATGGLGNDFNVVPGLQQHFKAAAHHGVVAVYGGDALNGTSSSAPLVFDVAKAATTTTVTSNSLLAAFGSRVTFTVAVAGVNGTETCSFG